MAGDGSVEVVYRDKTFRLPDGITVRNAIRRCGLSEEAVLAIRDGQLLTGDVRLRKGDKLKLVAVVSGG